MEARGSLRQLHQQLSSLDAAAAALAPAWPPARQRPPPPSLPPWAASATLAADCSDTGGCAGGGSAWSKPRPLRPKRVAAVPLLPRLADSRPLDEQEPPPQLGRPPREQSEPIDAATLKPPLGSGGPDARRELPDASNQAEDAREERSTGFFRPWKKASGESAAGAGGGDARGNKWKDRALSNPFAKRRPAASARPRSPAVERESPGERERHAAPRPPPHSAPASAADRGAPSRPPTPSLSDPSLPVQRHPLRPRVLRSRDGRDTREPEPSEPSPRPAEPSPATNQRREADSVDARGSSPSDGDGGGGGEEAGGRDEDAAAQAPDWRLRRPAVATAVAARQSSKPSKPPKPSKTKAVSTLDALADIKRKRDERRQQQAEEKQRIKMELEAHGDDGGYRFRRLISQFRAALPAAQATAAVATAGGRSPSAGRSPSPPSAARLLVFVRKRPLSRRELRAKGYDVLTCLYAPLAGGGEQLDTRLRRELLCHEPKLKVDCSEALEHHRFRFDGVFDDAQANEHVYEATVGPMVPFLLPATALSARLAPSHRPSNLTIFAYGQTGSGKTYTMKSMYRQAAAAIFSRLGELCAAAAQAPRVSVGISFYEIYMNAVNDLLNGRSRVQIMEDGDGAVQLAGLTELPIESADELLALVARGEDARATSANAVHDDSSRSHALLRVTLYAETTQQQQAVMARLSMVDLAGSERASDTQSDSKSTRMEGAEINKSLLALKECIRALDRGATHVPFRQSKLTQLLRDSFLSENSKTVMIATVSPWSESCNHTLNTLRYADRLKEIGGA